MVSPAVDMFPRLKPTKQLHWIVSQGLECRHLGLEVPAMLLARADEVIE
jgi:hypothetical protein